MVHATLSLIDAADPHQAVTRHRIHEGGHMDNTTFKNPRDAFEQAIEAGRLSRDPRDPHYAGNFMYMYTNPDGIDCFKDIITRQYLGGVY
jgi:hypothetical protein